MSDSDESAVDRALRRAGEREDPTPAEPDEFDPDSLGPDPPDPTAEDVSVDEETARAFWSAVVLANVGLFAGALGPMLAYFRGQLLVGTAVFLVGAVALARTYRIARDYGGDQ
ncbi:hypothetical protein [Halosegnis sp.]|uniref:DUF7322 domain-containing protein n=1 Tax=Halosegnis sp. TaxID=2864959 RepID=UPI0035D4BCD6